VGYHAPHLLDGMSEDLYRKKRIVCSKENAGSSSTKSQNNQNAVNRRLVVSSRTREIVSAQRLSIGSRATSTESITLDAGAYNEKNRSQRIEFSRSSSFSERLERPRRTSEIENEAYLNVKSATNQGDDETDFGNEKIENIEGRIESGRDGIVNSSKTVYDSTRDGNQSLFPEWFGMKSTKDNKKDEFLATQTPGSVNPIEKDPLLPDISDNDPNLRLSERDSGCNSRDSTGESSSRSDSRDISSAKRRFKLPNILKPRNSFASRDKNVPPLATIQSDRNIPVSQEGPESDEPPARHPIISTPTKMIAMALGQRKRDTTIAANTPDTTMNRLGYG
jgi:hypothetical protein